ncbi:MFS transporter [Polyangium fumosum]|uniref:MFS transporter n=2 Tax=Polyangium fumosum TaxID=889272 RepID=A0A4U1IG41_9BACT|nr:MFS transporter [Polyangium fumosum]
MAITEAVSRRSPPARMLAAAGVVTAVFVLSNAPTPLYVRWQSQLGFSSSTLTALFSVYIAGLLATLAIAGQCADRFGSRAVLVPGLGAGMVACVLFATAESVPALLVARFVSGIAVATAITAGMASVMELGGAARRRMAALLASTSLVLGAALGPLLAGSCALALDRPSEAVFSTELAILSATVLLVQALPFAPDAPPSRAWRPHWPSVPRQSRMHIAVGISAFGCAMSCTAFVLSLGPSVLAQLNGVTNPLVAGAMACAMFITATLAQLPARRAPVRVILRLSFVAIILGMAALVIAVATSLASALLIGAMFAGAGHGLAQLAGLTLIGLYVPEQRRAEATAVLNIGGYVPCGLMPILTGLLVDRTSLAFGTTCFAVGMTLIAVGSWLFVRRALRLIPPVRSPMTGAAVPRSASEHHSALCNQLDGPLPQRRA